MMHHEILSEDEFVSEFYADTFCDWATCVLASQNMIVLQNIVLSQTMWILDQQKDKKKILVIDSDMQSENKAHGAGECSFASAEEWIEDISWKLEDFIGVSDIMTECNNLQRVTEITELILGNCFFELVASQTFITNRMKNHVKSMIKL